MKAIVAVFFIWMVGSNHLLAKILPNPLLSRGLPVWTSSGMVYYLTDNLYKTEAFDVKDTSWIALRLSTGCSRILFSWNSPSYSWSDKIAAMDICLQRKQLPTKYTIETSSNSSNGVDGDWKVVISVDENIVTARSHEIPFEGALWVKMHITRGGGQLDEIEVFDFSGNGSDTWFFTGTSITAHAFKDTIPPITFADYIHAEDYRFTPSIVRGGIPCLKSRHMASNISQYIEVAGRAAYWAIDMGTNDGYQSGNVHVAAFKQNLQLIIDSCKARGIKPIIANVIATNPAITRWQIHPDYLKAVGELTKENGLLEGPDLYAWFVQHPEELMWDGIHPNAKGNASIQRLWAEKMLPLYSSITGHVDKYKKPSFTVYPNPLDDGKLHVRTEGAEKEYTLHVTDVSGVERGTFRIYGTGELSLELDAGIYFLKFVGSDSEIQKLVVK